MFASTQKNKLELISYQAKSTHNGLARNVSTVSGLSGASVATNVILENATLMNDPVVQRTTSSRDVDSDEETSKAIGKEQTSTPKNKRKDQIRSQEKEKNRLSFRFFKGNRKSQYDGN